MVEKFVNEQFNKNSMNLINSSDQKIYDKEQLTIYSALSSVKIKKLTSLL